MHKYVDISDPSVATEIMAAIQQVSRDANYEDKFDFFSWGNRQEELYQNPPEEFFFNVENSDSDSDIYTELQ